MPPNIGKSEHKEAAVVPGGSSLSLSARVKGKMPTKVRVMWERYGVVFIGTHLTAYVSTVAGLYVLFNNGLISSDLASWAAGGHFDADDPHGVYMILLKRFGLQSYASGTISPSVGNFALAWLTTKVTEPVRLGLTIAVTPTIARALGRAPRKDQPEEVS